MDGTTHHPHRITVCTSCRHKHSKCRPGLELISKLREAMAVADGIVSRDFEVSGVACMACMAGCDRPCTVAYHATAKATYLFGDIEPGADVDDLVAFARQYRNLEDGWCSSTTRPGKLRRSTLARVPAALIVAEVGPVQ
jgi:predicted metal-binding protein